VPAKSTKEQWSNWRVSLESDSQKHWTGRDLRTRFEEQTGIKYSPSHWHYLLRHQEKMYFYKPSPVDYRKNEEADNQLQERLRATFDALLVMGKDPKSMSIGFADEVAGQLHSNNARFWAFENHISRPVNTTRSTKSFFGFYALQGNSILCELSGGKEEDIKQALIETKNANKDYKGMILIWDNAQTHKSLQKWGWEHQIYFILLPPYSPDLNPLERVWKSMKKWVNEEQFIKTLEELATLYHQSFNNIKNQLSFMEGWWIKYQDNLSWYSTIFNSSTI
jgi:hypothetical protein